VRALDESTVEETELEIRRLQKDDSIAVIYRVRIKHLSKSRFSISLCRLQCLLLVRPINEVDVARLQNEFVMGYRDGDRAIYVSPYNNLDEVLLVSDDIRAPGVHYDRSLVMSLIPCSRRIPTSLNLLARCFSFRKGIIA
jgi:hypothetical protein